jgi:DNA helicase IV
MKKLGSPMINKTMTLNAIDKWETERLAAGSRSAEDIADCMRVFAHHGDRLTTMISYAEHIFKQNGTISLITGHKAKGLEYDNVIFLDPHLLDHNEQNQNLRYVIQTRSKNKLTELDSDVISW